MSAARLLLVAAALLLGLAAAAAQTPDAALDRLLAEARAGDCDAPAADALSRVLCGGRIRIGVRGAYPLFAEGRGDDRTGYDVDVARAIARRLGVAPEWVDVRAATRISTLAEGGADVVIATMGHNTRRDGEAHFIRPHYYLSETIVVGPRETDVRGWDDLAGRAVCATIGNYANAAIVSENVRLMLFEDAGRLPDALRSGSCPLAAQDDSFFASYLVDPAFGARFERKFGFDPVPWGMAVPLGPGSDRLAAALDLLSATMHRDGTFLAIARDHAVPTAFLEAQQRLWASPACADAAAVQSSACVLPALDATPTPTRFAPQVDAAVAWLGRTFGTAPELPMLTSVPAWELFLAGAVNSLVLVFGAIAATVAVALAVGRLAASPWRLPRLLAWAIVTPVQSSPVVLTLVVASAVAQSLFAYSTAVALGAAIVALGLMNGCNAGQAIGEAAAGLRRTDPAAPFAAAIGRSLTQLLSFVVNAAKGTPVASFTGAPELLSALTDITSFAAGRVTTYTIVLLFYIGVVAGVVWAGNLVRARLERTGMFA